MFEMYKTIFREGVDLQFGKLTLVDLSHYRCGQYRPGKYKYQIYCDDNRTRFFKCYYETQVDDAIKKFLEIKNKIKAQVR
jgi:hypothetical protein